MQIGPLPIMYVKVAIETVVKLEHCVMAFINEHMFDTLQVARDDPGNERFCYEKYFK